MPRTIATTVLALLMLLGLPAHATAQPAAPPTDTPSPGIADPPEEEPPFVDLAGHETKVSQHLGHVVVLNFWATWCGPCRAELPALEAVHDEFGPRGVHLIGASANGRDEGPTVKAMLDQLGITFEVWLWVTAKDMRHWGVGPAIPATVILDRQGAIRATFRGPITPDALRPTLEKLLAEPADAPK